MAVTARSQLRHVPPSRCIVQYVRVQARVERSVAAADLLRGELAAWLAARAPDPGFARFGHHFEVIETVMYSMLSGIRAGLTAVTGTDSGAAYARCHELDRSLLTVKRLFDWYAPKYDQRLDPVRGPVLAAADEIVRSCWWQPFDVLGRRPPPGPLPYLDPLFDAFTTPRREVPRALRAPDDALVAELADKLIPVISLPAWAVREPWWLVVAAHETGHLVMHDLDLAYEATAAAGDWADEVFADVYSALMVGPAAAWLVDELMHGLPVDGLYYPPLDRRLAIIGLSDPLASAMLELTVDGHRLASLAGALDGRLVTAWTSALASDDPTITKVRSRDAARAMIAAGVAAPPGPAVRRNLLTYLPKCGPPGTMGSAPPAGDVRALADRLTRRVLR